MPKKTEYLIVRVDERQMRRYKELAAKKGSSLSMYVRDLLDQAAERLLDRSPAAEAPQVAAAQVQPAPKPKPELPGDDVWGNLAEVQKSQLVDTTRLHRTPVKGKMVWANDWGYEKTEGEWVPW